MAPEKQQPSHDAVFHPASPQRWRAAPELRNQGPCVRVVCVAIYTIATVELIGGAEKREIELVPPDPAWPERFAVERAKIVAALGAKAIRVDHIGSTSIPGTAAKPIIDIDLSVKDVDDEEDYLPALTAAGYQLRVRE